MQWKQDKENRMKHIVTTACIIIITAIITGCASQRATYDDGVISGCKALVLLQHKGLTTTNITWQQVLHVGRQLEGQNQDVWKLIGQGEQND